MRPRDRRAFLILPSRDAEEGVDDQYNPLAVNREEGQLVDPLGMAPCETAEELVGGPDSIGQVSDGEFSSGA